MLNRRVMRSPAERFWHRIDEFGGMVDDSVDSIEDTLTGKDK